MKLATNNTSNYSTITKTSDFGISSNDAAHIMRIMSSTVYSDKLLAIIREYSTNALDAHIEASINKPIHVNLPTEITPILSIRDYGRGLSNDEIINTYTKYGSSTKRSSNDFTGCLGIGCKAGFAYDNQCFTIISYTPTTKTTWYAEWIDQNKPPTISITNTEQNQTGTTGVQIDIPILKKDIDQCVHTARNFFKYWDVIPTSNVSLEKAEYFECEDSYKLVKQRRHYTNGGFVFMGNIIYPIDTNKLTGTAALVLKNTNLIALAPLGALDIAANRETLEYNQRTINSLTAIANNIYCDLTNKLSKSVANCNTRLTASIESNRYEGVLNYDFSNSLRKKAMWRGAPLIHSIAFNGAQVVSHKLEKTWRNSSAKPFRNKKDTNVHSVSISKNTIFCVHDRSKFTETNATRRIRTLQSKNINTNAVYYVIPKDLLYLLKPTLHNTDYIDLSTVDPLPANRTIIKNPDGSKKKSVRINVCHVKPAQLKSERISQEAKPELCTLTNKYVYIPLDRFDWDGKGSILDRLGSIQESLKIINNDYVPTINGVKKHYVSKLNKDWITLDQYFDKAYKQWRRNNKKLNQLIIDATSLKEWNNWSETQARTYTAVTACKRIKYLAEVITYSTSTDNNKIKLRELIANTQLLSINDAKHAFIKTENAWAKDNYPLLHALHLSFSKTKDKKLINHINKYIKSVS